MRSDRYAMRHAQVVWRCAVAESQPQCQPAQGARYDGGYTGTQTLAQNDEVKNYSNARHVFSDAFWVEA